MKTNTVYKIQDRKIDPSEHFGLVYSIVKRKRSNIEHSELVQIGMLGLLEAASRYQASLGSFSHYAHIWINKLLDIAIGKQLTPAHIGEKSAGKIIKIAAIASKLRKENQEEPSIDDIANIANMCQGKVESALLILQSDNTEPENISIENESAFCDMFELSLKKFLLANLASLSNDESEVLILRYGLRSGTTMSLAQIAQEINRGISSTHVILTRAQSKLKDLLIDAGIHSASDLL